MTSAPAETHYSVLGVTPRATPDEIESAHAHAASLYEEGSLATYSLLEPEQRRSARRRVEEAYSVLCDPVRRRDYDCSLGLLPDPSAPGVPGQGPNGVTRAGVVVLPDPVTGAELKRFRESRGIPLREIAARSKVGVRFLEYIEAERVESLPALVYLRGFVQEYARAVGLEPRHTAERYLARVTPR